MANKKAMLGSGIALLIIGIILLGAAAYMFSKKSNSPLDGLAAISPLAGAMASQGGANKSKLGMIGLLVVGLICVGVGILLIVLGAKKDSSSSDEPVDEEVVDEASTSTKPSKKPSGVPSSTPSATPPPPTTPSSIPPPAPAATNLIPCKQQNVTVTGWYQTSDPTKCRAPKSSVPKCCNDAGNNECEANFTPDYYNSSTKIIDWAKSCDISYIDGNVGATTTPPPSTNPPCVKHGVTVKGWYQTSDPAKCRAPKASVPKCCADAGNNECEANFTPDYDSANKIIDWAKSCDISYESSSIGGPAECCGGQGGTPEDLKCPNGTYVTSFYGKAGTYLDSIGFTCSDNSSVTPRGGSGGAEYQRASIFNSGFQGIDVKSGTLIDSISPVTANTPLPKVGGNGGDGPYQLRCPTGQVKGLKLRYGNLIDNLKLIC
jgi:hypothetical protein